MRGAYQRFIHYVAALSHLYFGFRLQRSACRILAYAQFIYTETRLQASFEFPLTSASQTLSIHKPEPENPPD